MPSERRPSTCRKRFSFPGAGNHSRAARATCLLPLRYREAQLQAWESQPESRRQISFVFQVLDAPAGLLEFGEPTGAILALLRRHGSGRRPAAYPIGKPAQGQAETEHLFGERFRIRGLELAPILRRQRDLFAAA